MCHLSLSLSPFSFRCTDTFVGWRILSKKTKASECLRGGLPLWLTAFSHNLRVARLRLLLLPQLASATCLATCLALASWGLATSQVGFVSKCDGCVVCLVWNLQHEQFPFCFPLNEQKKRGTLEKKTPAKGFDSFGGSTLDGCEQSKKRVPDKTAARTGRTHRTRIQTSLLETLACTQKHELLNCSLRNCRCPKGAKG